MEQTVTEQMPNMMKAPLADPSKNPALAQQLAPEGEGPPLPPQ